MEILGLTFIVLLNVGISWWNCYAVGTAWKDVHTTGSGWMKAVLWSGAIQSVVGFSMAILVVLLFGGGGLMAAVGWVDAETYHYMVEFGTSLWYLAIIVPALGSGYIVTAHSLMMAFKYRDFGSMATAGWNVYASINNTVHAIRGIGGAVNTVAEFAIGMLDSGSSSNSKKGGGLIVVVMVIMSIVGGAMLAYSLIKKYANQTESYAEKFAKENGYM